MRCQRCHHRLDIHRDVDGNPVPCRLTGCDCPSAVEAVAQESTEARRICIDVPDGYMVSVSLVPYSADESGDDEEAA